MMQTLHKTGSKVAVATKCKTALQMTPKSPIDDAKET